MYPNQRLSAGGDVAYIQTSSFTNSTQSDSYEPGLLLPLRCQLIDSCNHNTTHNPQYHIQQDVFRGDHHNGQDHPQGS
jgi:hypothetical protein